MITKRTLWIVLFAAIVLLICSIATSVYWLTQIYLPQQMDVHKNARLLVQWEEQDLYLPPENQLISQEKLILFIKVNESLYAQLQKIRQELENHFWTIAFEMIRLQPEWAGQKYLALKKFHLSPKEYDWIAEQVVDFWIFRWKEESLENLAEYGWNFEDSEPDSEKPVNYELFLDYEEDLNRIFDILWREKSADKNPETKNSIDSLKRPL